MSAAERVAQGLPERIEDETVLAKAAAILLDGAEGRDPPSNRPPEGGRRAQNPAKEPSIEHRTRTVQTGQGSVRRGGGRARR